MRRFYRNRHATFIKTLLEQKTKKQEAEEEMKVKEEKRKKKLRDKVMANIQRKDELPPIDNVEHADPALSKTNSALFNSQLIQGDRQADRNRGLSVSVIQKDRQRQGTSMSARDKRQASRTR